ncbi:MAG: ATP-binding protein [Candidatus Krumholzibacteria bacterium]|nr:ATP-binding protein [Candidatus Krumholzibacteria bacterium]MDH4337195.1 ATP-binding protein [Candidatus Krumholzibacteria bacterium]MDH5268658.1 ATP-binding protein [Candidatus Krumholzibacteria bacterium]
MGGNVEQMILNIPSDLKYLGAVDAAIQDLAREFSFSLDAINDVSTALIEACSNAIEHGNRFDPNKRVVVTLCFNGQSFAASVKDEGSGFNFQKALDEDSPPDPMSERGRGLMIMKAFTDRLSFRYADGGLYVELAKNRGDDGPEE